MQSFNSRQLPSFYTISATYGEGVIILSIDCVNSAKSQMLKGSVRDNETTVEPTGVEVSVVQLHPLLTSQQDSLPL